MAALEFQLECTLIPVTLEASWFVLFTSLAIYKRDFSQFGWELKKKDRLFYHAIDDNFGEFYRAIWTAWH